MAFEVTPTSGDAPYILSADILDSDKIDGVNYVASVRTSISEGSCPGSGSASPLPSETVDLLLSDGSVDSGYTSVPSGSCRTFTLRITRVSDNVVIALSSISVDNV